MQYRAFGRTGERVSVLGFGAMRLPRDPQQAVRCLQRGLELGVNVIDTAPTYGDSELIVRDAIAGRRRQVYLSTKNPLRDDSGAGWRRRLEQSLRRLGAEYIDFYQVAHNLHWRQFVDNLARPGAGLRKARRAQEEGLIRHLCFSSHDTPDNIIRLVHTGEFEGVILQYNLLDRSNEPAIAVAAQAGMGVLVMGPVAGGRLAAAPPPLRELVGERWASSADLALRFVLANKGVSCALSGMKALAMVEENCRAVSRAQPLNPEERQRLQIVLEQADRLAREYCSECAYCMPCPHGVNIPLNLRMMNYHRVYQLTDYARFLYRRWSLPDSGMPGLPASACRRCRECEARCPQGFPVSDRLRETHAVLGRGASRVRLRSLWGRVRRMARPPLSRRHHSHRDRSGPGNSNGSALPSRSSIGEDRE